MELNLQEIRKEINDIDEKIVELFKKRMNCAASVAQYKAEHNLPVLDSERERALLTKICNMAGEEFDTYALTLYNTMLDVSKAYQHKILNSEYRNRIRLTRLPRKRFQTFCRSLYWAR